MRSTPKFKFKLRTKTEGKDRSIFLAGNFNNWDAQDERFKMTRMGPGDYELLLPQINLLPQRLEYKYHRGSWDEVELDQYGNEAVNRFADLTKGNITDWVPRWKISGQTYDPKFLPRIQIISESFEIPQLIKTRRIAALLPYDYDRTDKRYPVLYLQDGQNLYDDFAPFGSWSVDKKLAVMAERGTHEIIVISIDHAEEERIAEFTPSYNTRLGIGHGKNYVKFLVETLKPYIDRHFRTLPERKDTGIGGSSMGGLISLYAELKYPNVYSKLMIFSPSLWVAPNIHFESFRFDAANKTKMYLYAGEAEGANVVANIQKLKATLEAKGHRPNIEFKLAIDPEGEHNEKRWGEEFSRAVEWLFFEGKSKND